MLLISALAYVISLFCNTPVTYIHLCSRFWAVAACLISSLLRFLDNCGSTEDCQLNGLLWIASTVAESWLGRFLLLIRGVHFSRSKTTSQCIVIVCYSCSDNVLSAIIEPNNSVPVPPVSKMLHSPQQVLKQKEGTNSLHSSIWECSLGTKIDLTAWLARSSAAALARTKGSSALETQGALRCFSSGAAFCFGFLSLK